jgi:hypothetical protein
LKVRLITPRNFLPPEGKTWNNKGMNRLRYFFAAILLILALPFWRSIDLIGIISPFEFPATIALMIWFALFVAIPIKLIFKNIKTLWLNILIIGFGALAWWSSPLSHMATVEPDFNHCGQLTYTGMVYPLRGILTDAHRDDLEARNQMCWVRKLISKVPKKFDEPKEIETYSTIIRDRLLKPENKYRATLPLIAFLNIKIITAASDHAGAKEIYDSLHFWIDHYTDEISSREYPAWNWPHGDYIKWEYGLIEKNWQKLIDNIVIEIN